MDDPTSDKQIENAERQARKRVRELKDFYSHLAIFLVVNACLVAMNLLSSPESFWAIWPLLGWGIGLLSHAVSVFGLFGIGNKEWEERKVQELIMRNKQLTADEVRHLLREELPTSTVDADRIVRRLEHLETIVTSKDWDFVEEREPEIQLDPPEDVPDSEVEHIAKRVR